MRVKGVNVMYEDKEYSQQATRGQRIARERAVYRYTTALASGDVDTLVAVLQEAEHDPVLEQMVVETHTAYEGHTTIHADELEQARNLLFAVSPSQEMTWQGSKRSSIRPPTRMQRFGALARSLAAVLVVCALLGSFLILFAAHHPGSGTWILPDRDRGKTYARSHQHGRTRPAGWWNAGVEVHSRRRYNTGCESAGQQERGCSL